MTTIAYNTKTHKVGFLFKAKATNDDFNAASQQIGRNAFVESLDHLKLKELAEIYNAHAAKPVNKFPSKDYAVERVERVLKEMDVPVYDSGAKPAKKPKVKKPKVKKAPGSASAAIAKSWTDANVFKARTTRHAVTVNKQSYSSVHAAFEALDLPMGQHIAFRMKLKAAGKLTFAHDGKNYNFTAHLQES